MEDDVVALLGTSVGAEEVGSAEGLLGTIFGPAEGAVVNSTEVGVVWDFDGASEGASVTLAEGAATGEGLRVSSVGVGLNGLTLGAADKAMLGAAVEEEDGE
jgi:hypothetical protein